ncbi:MAG TPA: type II toxin-antitoxin system HipA family toxin [Kofleriaceae bacterium]|nr:type II toxin-antitoxin system HipA family toxin [Kofleriaceae bacterium]
MARTIDVHIADAPRAVALLRHEERGARESASFEYVAEWLADRERFAIDPTLPLVRGPQFHKRSKEGSLFHNALADTEPDGWARRVILRDHQKRRQAGETVPERLNELDFLLAVDDATRVGALRFRDERNKFCRAPDGRRRTTPPLVELSALLTSSKAVELNRETAADLAYLRGRGTSLGGQRPKCSVIDDHGNLSIGKFPSVSDERAVTKGEVLALTLARKAGIRAAHAELVDADGSPVALIRRFDRSGVKRTLYVSAATLTGVDPHEGSDHSYTEIADAIRVHGDSVQADLEELWRRLAFTILITNVDDHLMNHGFLYATRGRWRLSPAFDVNPFPERARELKLWISEEAGPAATVDGLMSVAPYFKISQQTAKTILRQVEAAVARWRAEGKRLGMSAPELEQFEPAFEHSERAAARKVAATR